MQSRAHPRDRIGWHPGLKRGRSLMIQDLSRRKFLHGLAAGAVVLGFDPVRRSWITEAYAREPLDNLPPLDGVLLTDDASKQEASDDFGHIVHRLPRAVLRPASIEDIVTIVRFARRHDLKV